MLSTLLAALAALPLAAPALVGFPADNLLVQQPGLIRYPITVSEGAPFKNNVFRRQNDVDLVSQKTGYFYSIQLNIGTPPQAVSVNFDTGSNTLWVNPVCSKSTDPKSCESFGRFDGSDTFVDMHKSGSVRYGTGQASLEYGYDYVQIGDAKISKQIFGVADDSDFVVTGILGAGPNLSGWDNSYPLVIDNLAEQGFTNSRAFSLDIRSIESKRGSVVFGGIDTKKFSGKLEKRPIIPATLSPDGYTRYWIYLDGISVTRGNDCNGSVVDVFDKPNGLAVLLDSGYTVTSVPPAIFKKILAAFPGAEPIRGTDMYAVPCSTGDSEGHVDFKFGRTVVEVPYKDFIWHQPQNGVCVLGVVADENVHILGDTFLRAAYVVYDQDNRNIHVANTEDCGSNLVAIGKGPNAVPSVAGDCSSPPTTCSASGSAPTTAASSLSSKPTVTGKTSSSAVSTTSAGTTTSVVTSKTGGVGTTSKHATTSKPVTTPRHNTTAIATYTSTFTTHTTYTVTSCPPYVTNCPVGSLTTKTITGTTT
ncbi:Secreted aspartic proteinase, partial [Tolypocladium capitatum]